MRSRRGLHECPGRGVKSRWHWQNDVGHAIYHNWQLLPEWHHLPEPEVGFPHSGSFLCVLKDSSGFVTTQTNSKNPSRAGRCARAETAGAPFIPRYRKSAATYIRLSPAQDSPSISHER